MYNIPASPIKTNREWEKKIHSGYWCLCCDYKQGDKNIRLVLKTSKDSNTLCVFDASIYLVDPNGKRLSN